VCESSAKQVDRVSESGAYRCSPELRSFSDFSKSISQLPRFDAWMSTASRAGLLHVVFPLLTINGFRKPILQKNIQFA
jgi:hypothetical protein